MRSTHWSEKYIGLPWAEDGYGPNEYNCWGLTADVQQIEYDHDMPKIRVETFHGSMADIRSLIYHSRWSRETGSPRDGDVLLMSGTDGLHIGTVIKPETTLMVLHAVGNKLKGGEVRRDRLDVMLSMGFGRRSHWRYQ